jgi:hypothetical protein
MFFLCLFFARSFASAFSNSKFVGISFQVLNVVAPTNDIVDYTIDHVSTTRKAVVHVPQESSKKSNVNMFDDNVYNELFDNELLKYRVHLKSIHCRLPMGVVIVNIVCGHVFSNLNNYPITINYMVHSSSTILASIDLHLPSIVVTQPWFNT